MISEISEYGTSQYIYELQSLVMISKKSLSTYSSCGMTLAKGGRFDTKLGFVVIKFLTNFFFYCFIGRFSSKR